jgi:hypothetical protein
MALKQQYGQLSTDYQHLHQMIIDIRSKMSDDICTPLFWPFRPGNDQPPPPPSSSRSRSRSRSAIVLV